MMYVPFTQEERDFLILNGWEVGRFSVACKDYTKIKKLHDNDFEVEKCMTDEPDGNDYWEFDSEWTSLEKAMRLA